MKTNWLGAAQAVAQPGSGFIGGPGGLGGPVFHTIENALEKAREQAKKQGQKPKKKSDLQTVLTGALNPMKGTPLGLVGGLTSLLINKITDGGIDTRKWKKKTFDNLSKHRK